MSCLIFTLYLSLARCWPSIRRICTAELPQGRPSSPGGDQAPPGAARLLSYCLVLSINLIHCGNEFPQEQPSSPGGDQAPPGAAELPRESRSRSARFHQPQKQCSACGNLRNFPYGTNLVSNSSSSSEQCITVAGDDWAIPMELSVKNSDWSPTPTQPPFPLSLSTKARSWVWPLYRSGCPPPVLHVSMRITAPPFGYCTHLRARNVRKSLTTHMSLSYGAPVARNAFRS